MFTVLLIICIFLMVAASIGLPVIACVYVYNDAKKRGMNAVLWVLLTLFLSIPLGLIVYLIAREQSFSQTRCPNCGEAVAKTYNVCPRCGRPLHANCPGCGRQIQPGWNSCPDCGTSLANANTQGVYEEPKSGMSLKTLIITAIVLFAVLIMSIIGVVGLAVASETKSEYHNDYEDFFENEILDEKMDSFDAYSNGVSIDCIL